MLREIRRWRLVSGVLLVVILGLGGFSAYLLRSLDADYSELLDGSLPVLNELRTLGNNALSTQRALLNGLLAANPGARDESIVRARRFIDAGGKLRRSLKAKEIFAHHAAAYDMLEKAGDTYASAADETLLRLQAERMAEADGLRLNQARPALDHYLAQIDIAARYVESRSQAVNASYTDSARNRSAIMVALASLPLIVAGLVLLVVGALLVIMILMFRRLGPDDAR